MLMRSRRCPVRAHLPWWTVSGSSSDGVPCWSGRHRHPAEMLAQAERLERDGRTVVYVSRSKDALGIIGLMDAPKPDAAAAVAV